MVLLTTVPVSSRCEIELGDHFIQINCQIQLIIFVLLPGWLAKTAFGIRWRWL